MFVGHYGVSFAARLVNRAIPLWVLFVAVQWLDVVWAPLVLLGIEKVRIVPGFTATNPLDLYYMPYTHSLIAALLWSIAGIAVYHLLTGTGWKTSLLIGVAILSHWVLDFVVHVPDLSVYGNAMKVWTWAVEPFGSSVAKCCGGDRHRGVRDLCVVIWVSCGSAWGRLTRGR